MAVTDNERYPRVLQGPSSLASEPTSSVQLQTLRALRPRSNSAPSFNTQNNTSSSIAHSVGISVRVSGSGLFPFSPFPKGSKYFRDPDRSRDSLSPSSSSARSLPADQKCGRCYLRIPRRRCSFRRVQRPPQTSFARRRIHTLPVAADLIYLAAGRVTQILRCQIEFAAPRRGMPAACLVDEVDAGGGLVTRCFRFSASSSQTRSEQPRPLHSPK